MNPGVWESMIPLAVRDAVRGLTADEHEHFTRELAAGGRLRVALVYENGSVLLRLQLISATGRNSWVYDVAAR